MKWLFTQTGFTDRKIDTIHIIFEFGSPESYTALHHQTGMRIGATLAIAVARK